jgi:hypothetical protein
MAKYELITTTDVSDATLPIYTIKSPEVERRRLIAFEMQAVKANCGATLAAGLPARRWTTDKVSKVFAVEVCEEAEERKRWGKAARTCESARFQSNALMTEAATEVGYAVCSASRMCAD